MSDTTTLQYTKIQIPPRGSFPARTIYAPLVKTFLFQKTKRADFSFDSVVDSGADFCVFPAQFGELVGLDIERGQDLPTFGVGGKGTIFFHKIKVGIAIGEEIWKFECHAGFSKKMNTGLLGRDGFFDLFNEVSFNQHARMFRLKGEGTRSREPAEELFE